MAGGPGGNGEADDVQVMVRRESSPSSAAVKKVDAVYKGLEKKRCSSSKGKRTWRRDQGMLRERRGLLGPRLDFTPRGPGKCVLLADEPLDGDDIYLRAHT
jgi:hypothetical protein